MSEGALVSVVMAAYKEKDTYIRKAIESILNQSYRNFEFIIILDNPENKGLEEIIREYEGKDKRIKFLINEKIWERMIRGTVRSVIVEENILRLWMRMIFH